MWSCWSFKAEETSHEQVLLYSDVCAFERMDGSAAAIILNRIDRLYPIHFRMDERRVSILMPPEKTGTIIILQSP